MTKNIQLASPSPALSVNQAAFEAIFIDRGRQSYQQDGLTESGPMDEYSFLWANKLLNNPITASCIEISFGLFSITALKPCSIAVCGADFTLQLNSQPISTWQSINLKKNDTLNFQGPRNQGTRAYLAIAGGFASPVVFGSACTVKRESLGGLRHGQGLKKGDCLLSHDQPLQQKRRVTPENIRHYNNKCVIGCRFIPCYQWPLFSAIEQQRFLQQRFKISSQSDRMGFRLNGDSINSEMTGIISEPIALGAIQIPANGQPIILLRDRQTIGGYPKLGTVLSTDIEKIGQAMPGQEIQFMLCDIETAYQERLRRENFFKHLADF